MKNRYRQKMNTLSEYLHVKPGRIWSTQVGVMNLNANASKHLHFWKSYEVPSFEFDHE